MDIVLIVGAAISFAFLVSVLCYGGYRAGWSDGHEAAYQSMIRDLREGKQQFASSGLQNWEIPQHWLKEVQEG